MTIALVHGNPEVAQIWDAMRAELGRDDVVALSPPGFGGDVPDGFGSTAAEYAAWLAGELEQLDGPIHLIGHDWGGGHVIGATLLVPHLLASVTTDIAGAFAPGYTWHDMAQVWRTEGAGEDAIEALVTISVDDRTTAYEGLGMNRAAAEACAAAAPSMGPHILAVYRSAPESMFGEVSAALTALPGRPPIHVVVATEDPFTGGPEMAVATAERWDATVHRLDGLGHWWMMEDPARAASMVRRIVGA